MQRPANAVSVNEDPDIVVRRALAMATGEQYLRLAFHFLSIIVVSRLLTPADIGISVIGTGIVAVAIGLREFATSDFLIQRREVVPDDVRTSFTILFLLTASIVGGIFAFASWLGILFDSDKLPAFVRIAALAVLIEAVALPVRGLLRREMAFGKLAVINTVGACVNAGMTILLALAGLGFMSIAWGRLVSSMVAAVLSFSLAPPLPSFRPRLTSWRSVLAFGSYNGASYLVGQVYETFPQLVLGGILPPAAVGLYNRATTITKVPWMVFLDGALSVAFPAFAVELRQGCNLKRPYLRALSFMTVFYWPALAMLALLAYPAVRLILGQQWLSVVPLLQVMAVAHLAWFTGPLTTPVLLAVGANRDRALVLLFACPVAALVLSAAAHFGIMAMAASQLFIIPYLMVVALYFVRRHVAFGWCELGAALWKSAVVTATSVLGPLCVVGMLDWHLDLSIEATAVAILTGAVGWIAGVVVTRHPVWSELKKAAETMGVMRFARRLSALRERMSAPRPSTG